MRPTPTSQLRRGSAVWMVIGVIALTTATSMLAVRQMQDNLNITTAIVSQSNAQNAAVGCSAGALKVMPALLDAMIQLMEMGSDSMHADQLFMNQFDVAFFGDEPLGEAQTQPWCIAQIIDIQDDIPMVGYSRRGGCFKRVTLWVEGIVTRPDNDSSLEIQRETASTREMVLHGTFGPLACN